MKRIWYDPAGIAITHIPNGSIADLDSEGRKLLAAGRSYAAASHEDFEDNEILTFLPPDRTQRHKWRKNPIGRGVIIDTTVPDPPHPQQELLSQVVQADTVPELKAILVKLIKGERA